MNIDNLDTSTENIEFLRELGFNEIPDITYSEIFFIELIRRSHEKLNKKIYNVNKVILHGDNYFD